MSGTDRNWMQDDLGPAKVLFARLVTGADAVVVVDNVALGPAIGGVRMAAGVTAAEVARLARAMTLKNAAAGLPHGGGKAGIVLPAESAAADRERAMRAFARAIEHLVEYIPGPDMGTDETSMAFVHDEIGRCVGLPAVLGGIPLDQLGATGYGLGVCAQALEEGKVLELPDARVVVQGFGAVGRHAALALNGRGARVIAVSDRGGATYDPSGIDVAALAGYSADQRGVAGFPEGRPLPRDEILGLDCDILLPAAQADVFTAANAAGVRARVVLQGANIPATAEAEAVFHRRGVVSVPDIIANAGGVICAAAEYRGDTRVRAFAEIEDKIRENTAEMLDRARGGESTLRAAANEMAFARLRQAAGYRRTF